MTKIWSEENKYQIWFDIEILAAQEMAKQAKNEEMLSRVLEIKEKAKWQ